MTRSHKMLTLSVLILMALFGFAAGHTPLLRAATEAEDDRESVWLGTPSGVILVADGEQKTYGVEYGLGGEDVRAALVDREGHKWFGTNGGVTMYDGIAWTSYFPSYGSISSNYVHAVAMDGRGRTWFAYGEHGLGVSVKDGEEWQQYTEADGIGSDRVYSMAFGAGAKAWLGTGRGVSQWDGGRWSDLSIGVGAPLSKIEALAVSPAGILWAGFEGGVARYDGEQWTTYGPEQGLEVAHVQAIVFDDAGRIWVGAAPDPRSGWRSGGLFVFENGAWRAVAANRMPSGSSGPAAQPRGDWITDLAVDHEGQVWAGALAYPLAKPGFVGGGVSVHPEAGEWEIHTSGSGLAGDYVTALAVDSTGTRWAGTQDGLSAFDGKSWTTYTAAEGLPDNHVTDLAATAAGGLWVATAGGGAAYFDGRDWAYVTTAGVADREINDIAEDAAGNLWFATAGGVSRFDGEEWTVYTTLDGLAENYNRTIVADGNGNVWVGGGRDKFSGDALSRFDGTHWTAYSLRSNVTYSNVAALAVDGDGHAYAVAYNPAQFSTASALFAFDGEAWRAIGGQGPLADDRVLAFEIDGAGRMWFGTDGSYNSATLVTWDGAGWAAIPTGETATPVRAIALTQPGEGYLGTDMGLAAFATAGGATTITWHEAVRKTSVQAIAVER
jgi:ligand-binding sensor domain-containing protein